MHVHSSGNQYLTPSDFHGISEEMLRPARKCLSVNLYSIWNFLALLVRPLNRLRTCLPYVVDVPYAKAGAMRLPSPDVCETMMVPVGEPEDAYFELRRGLCRSPARCTSRGPSLRAIFSI